VSIGCYIPRLFSRTSFIKRVYRGYFNDILLMSRFSSIYKFLSPNFIRMSLIATIFLVVVILLMSGDIETNSGPFTILRSVKGSFHQGDPRLGEFVGTQCVCNSLFAIVSVIKNVSYWNSSDLNLILYEGTMLYRSLGYSNQYLSVDDLSNVIIIRAKGYKGETDYMKVVISQNIVQRVVQKIKIGPKWRYGKNHG